MLKPKSKGECTRLLIQTSPPLDHKWGYYGETCEKWAAKWDISKKRFWKAFGIGNTCAIDKKKNKFVFYPCDVERAIRECINKTWVSIEDWD
jgi:hypothetical protein